MNNQTSQIFESYVPVYDTVPEKWEDARQFLVEHLKKISNAVNIREIGWFLDEELLSGKQFIPSNPTAITEGTAPQFRTVLRKVIDFGSVAPIGIPVGIKQVPHGLVFDNNFTLLQLYGAATQPGTVGIGLGHAANPPQQVELYIDTTNITTISGVDRSAYTRVFVTIEYIQEL